VAHLFHSKLDILTIRGPSYASASSAFTVWFLGLAKTN